MIPRLVNVFPRAFIFPALALLFFYPGLLPAQNKADEAYLRGFALQQEMRTLEAIEAYQEALKINPYHGKANYEIGWSYWVLREWQKVVRHWEVALQGGAGPPELPDYLKIARERISGKTPELVRVPIGAQANRSPQPDNEEGGGDVPVKDQAGIYLSLKLIARFQQYNPKAGAESDHFDRYVFSPKSVLFPPGGDKVYVNALEGMTTLVFDPRALRRIKVIPHRFKAGEESLFDSGETADFWNIPANIQPPTHPNRFQGKPVEAVFSHNGKYLWVSYYRRDFDKLGQMPSAVAVVDTSTDRIVRVMATGPIPKTLAYSEKTGMVAVVNWGNNTVGLIDAGGIVPGEFKQAGEIVVVKRLSLDIGRDVDRDHYCGFCLRGAVFSSDGKYLLVGRMGGGGIAVLDVAARKHIGTVWGSKPTPRHLILSGDGETVYVGASASGFVSKYSLKALVRAAKTGRRTLKPDRQIKTGLGTRTIALSPDGALLFAAVNKSSRVVALDAGTLRKILEIPADSFPVGLAVSPDGGQLWVTSQGIKLRGGNSISVYRIGRETKKD